LAQQDNELLILGQPVSWLETYIAQSSEESIEACFWIRGLEVELAASTTRSEKLQADY
jgi:hypothetical protein